MWRRYALHILITNKLTNEHYNAMLEKLLQPHYKIKAIDSKKDVNTGRVSISMPQKSSEAGYTWNSGHCRRTPRYADSQPRRVGWASK